MTKYLESIKLENAKFSLLEFHQNRVDKTFRQHYPHARAWQLAEILSEKQLPESGLFKLRFVYDSKDYRIEIHPYQAKAIHSFQLVQDDQIDYTYKKEDRTNLKLLFQQKGTADDIIIVKNGLLTDSYYANIALLRAGQWYTPATPLLAGVKRNFLLQQGKLKAIDIITQDLTTYEKIAILNAMIDLEDQIGVPISAVFPLP